jgi:enoyl-CoA hydratase/carnithine racemase
MAGVTVSRRGAVGWVVLDRPEQRNALDLDARVELIDAFTELDADPGIRVAVITGAGTAFCAGTDLSGVQDPEHPLVRDPQRLAQPLDDFSKPLIAAVNGGAAGGGFEFALAADLRVASPHAKFLLPEVRIGSLPGSGGTQRIFHALPSAIAWKLLLTGTPIDAETALQHGLVSDVYPADEFEQRVTELAERIAEAAPLSLVAAKRAGRAALDASGPGLELERRLWAELAETHDRAEGRAAFREKRPPRFEGR